MELSKFPQELWVAVSMDGELLGATPDIGPLVQALTLLGRPYTLCNYKLKAFYEDTMSGGVH